MEGTMDCDSDGDQNVDAGSQSGSEDENQSLNRSTKNLVAGKIVSIQLKNLLTHTEANVYPSEQLNLVIGPNGTGKSSIVASIIIGMGGSTKILSERNKLCDYVKNGKDIAQITVTIYRDEQRNRKTFCREFNRQNKSTYTVDGRKVTEKEYCHQIKELNIQVGNLCQFLPQERVQDFAKQNPQELFASTQHSVCSDEMFGMFDKLKELRSTQLNGDKHMQRTADLLRDNERRVEALQTAVENIRRQDELLNRKNIIEKKLAWMDFQELYLDCKKIDKDLNLAMKSRDDTIKKQKELQKRVESTAKERQKYEKDLTTESTKKKKCRDELNRITGEIEDLESAIRNTKSDLDAYIQNGRERDKKINDCEMVLATYKQEAANHEETMGSVDGVKKQISDIDERVKKTMDRIRSLTESRSKFNYQIENVIKPSVIAIDNKIGSLNSVANAKLNFLQQHRPDTFAAIMWLRQNQRLFRGRIYEPLIVEVNVKSNEYCKYIENCVSSKDMFAFTCEETEDMNKFLKIMRVEQKLKINAVHSSAANGLRYKPIVPIDDVRKCGGVYLINCIDAPFPIMNYLCQIYNMHNVLVGNANLERMLDQLPPNLQLFFTPTHRIAVKTSKYTGAKSSMSDEMKSNNMFNVQVSKKDLEQLQEEKRKLIQSRDQNRNKRTEIEESITLLEAQCKTQFEEKAEHNKRILELEQMQKRVVLQERKLKRLQDEPFDLEAESERFSVRARGIVKQMFTLNANSIKVYEKMMAIELNEVKARSRLHIFKNGTADFDARLMEFDEELDRIKSYCDRIGCMLDKTKKEAKEKQDIALKMTDNRKPSEGDQFPYKKDFDELSNDRTELAEQMEDLERRISCRSSSDQSDLDEFRERVKTIESLKKELKKGDKSSGEVGKEIDTLHKKWFPQIKQIVASINENFSHFMQSMSCAGEVDLVYPSDRDYDKYGIEIRVKYRASETLRALNRFVQSGGERAVAIAVYSLSLQHLSQVPFRCVDEINQGMDPNNERRVFEMLVNNVAQPGQSQFFYVTPKLQQNLPFNNNVTCITVFNGPFTNHNDFFEDV